MQQNHTRGTDNDVPEKVVSDTHNKEATRSSKSVPKPKWQPTSQELYYFDSTQDAYMSVLVPWQPSVLQPHNAQGSSKRHRKKKMRTSRHSTKSVASSSDGLVGTPLPTGESEWDEFQRILKAVQRIADVVPGAPGGSTEFEVVDDEEISPNPYAYNPTNPKRYDSKWRRIEEQDVCFGFVVEDEAQPKERPRQGNRKKRPTVEL